DTEVGINISIKDSEGNPIDSSFSGSVELSLEPVLPFDQVYSHSFESQVPTVSSLQKNKQTEKLEITLQIEEGKIKDLSEYSIKVNDHLANANLSVEIILIKGYEKIILEKITVPLWLNTDGDHLPDLWEQYQIVELRNRGFDKRFTSTLTVKLRRNDGSFEDLEIWHPVYIYDSWDFEPVRNIYKPEDHEDGWIKDKGDGLRAIDEYRGFSVKDTKTLTGILNCYEIEKFVVWGSSVIIDGTSYTPENIFLERTSINGFQSPLSTIEENLQIKYIYLNHFPSETVVQMAYPYLGKIESTEEDINKTFQRFAQRHIINLKRYRDEDSEHINKYNSMGKPVALNRGLIFKFSYKETNKIWIVGHFEYMLLSEETYLPDKNNVLVKEKGTISGLSRHETINSECYNAIVYLGSIINKDKEFSEEKSSSNNNSFKYFRYNMMPSFVKSSKDSIIYGTTYREKYLKDNYGNPLEKYFFVCPFTETRIWYNPRKWNSELTNSVNAGEQTLEKVFLRIDEDVYRTCLHELGHNYSLKHPEDSYYLGIINNSNITNKENYYTPMHPSDTVYCGAFFQEYKIIKMKFNWID
ncbi:MAG: hypothetical protein PHV06_06375, partial [bacterium]|nr:hypothetical protein [bacterium]